jgi:hypothetical protein
MENELGIRCNNHFNWAKAVYSAKSHHIPAKKLLDSAKYAYNPAKIHGNSANWKLSSIFSNLTSKK